MVLTPPPEAEAWPDVDPGFYSSLFPIRCPLPHPVPSQIGLSGAVLDSTPTGTPNISGAPEGHGPSLVPSLSITVTPQIQPSDIALSALKFLDKLDRHFSIAKEFCDYLLLCEQKGFRIKGYDTKKGKIISYLLSYNNRWGSVRRKDLSEKLKCLEFWFEQQEDRPVTLVTLTSKQAGMSISSAWFELNKSRDKLRKLIFKYFGAVDYFWVVEPHKSGYAHYHMMVFAAIDNETKDKRGQGIEDKFRDLWAKKYKTGSHTYGLDFAQKKDDDKIKHLKKYLQKYLEKGFLLDKWTPGMLKFNAAMHDTGFRMYGASKNIREMMNIIPDKPSQIVWLETKISEPKKTPGGGTYTNVWGKEVILPGGEEYEEERVIWYRQYIPDWLDSDFWLTPEGDIVPEDPPPQYVYDWGRPCSHHVQEYKVVRWQDMNIPKRKREENPYDTWRPASHQNVMGLSASSGFMGNFRDQWGLK